MKKLLFYTYFFLFQSCLLCQNLIPNPSFEEFSNECPENFNEMPLYWTKWRESPNSFSSCVVPQSLSDSLGWAPLTGFGFQPAQDGNSFIGMLTFSGDPIFDFREIIGVSLIEPLEVGSTYYFNMHVAPSIGGYYGMQWISNKIGMQLTMETYDANDNPMPLNNFAHVFENDIVQDTAGWSLLSGSFIANEPYTHIAIGNFFNDAFTDTVHFSGSQSLGAYYFVDNLCLSKNPICTSNAAVHEIEQRVHLHPNPAKHYVSIQSALPIKAFIVRDLSGKILFENNGLDDPFSTKIDLTNFSSGHYLIEISTERSVYYEKLIVFNH